MKKLSVLMMAALLVVTCAALAGADVGQWASTDMTGYAEVWYVDYNKTVLNNVNGSTAQASVSSGTDGKWIVDRCFVAGYEAGRFLDNDDETNVVPVDLSIGENTVYIYAIVTRRVVIGLLFVKVNADDGTMTVEGEVRSGEVFFKGQPTLTVYTSISALSGEGIPCEAGEPISISETLGNARAVLIALNGYVAYSPIVSTDYRDGNIRYFALQDYWKNEEAWKNYRTRMLDALELVAP